MLNYDITFAIILKGREPRYWMSYPMSVTANSKEEAIRIAGEKFFQICKRPNGGIADNIWIIPEYVGIN